MLGICALIWPTLSLGILVSLVGLYLLADGVAGLVAAWRASERGPQLLQGVVGIVVGTVLLFWPGASVRTLLVVFGAWTVFFGITQIIEACRLAPEDTDRGSLTGIGAIATVAGLVLIFWPGTGVVTIAWAIAVAALVVAALLIFLALCLKRLGTRVATLTLKK